MTGKVEQQLANTFQDVRESVYTIRYQYTDKPFDRGSIMIDESKLLELPPEELLDRLKTIRQCTSRILDKLGE